MDIAIDRHRIRFGFLRPRGCQCLAFDAINLPVPGFGGYGAFGEYHRVLRFESAQFETEGFAISCVVALVISVEPESPG